MSGAVWGEVANAALQATSAYLNYDSQRQANLTNIRQARERNAFEERMSNTAIQRRAADIRAAGGNPALAFTNGSEATTPVVSAPTVEAAHFDAPRFNTAALAQKAQIDLIKAQTANQSAETRQRNIEADIREAGADLEVKYTGLGRYQQYENQRRQGERLTTEIGKLVSDTQLRQIQAYVAGQSKEATIAAIKSGALAKKLETITGASKAQIAEMVSKIADTVGAGWGELWQFVKPQD